MEQNTEVSFACQRCMQPLFLDKSFEEIGKYKKAELTLPLFTPPEVKLDPQETTFNQFVHPFSLAESGNTSNGFTLLGEGESNFGQNIEYVANLFDIISGNTEINHPLCEECTDSLLEMLDQHLRMVSDDCEHYKQYLNKLSKENFDLQALNKELNDLKISENRLIQELSALQEEEDQINKDIKSAENEKIIIEGKEEKYWRDFNKYCYELYSLEDDCKSLDNQLIYARVHLERLRKTNVFNTAFHIWHKGSFATINNYRFGRLQSEPVDWSEINAAWGQTALLLVSLAKAANVEFEKYRIVPFGNHSYIEVFEENKVLPLYCSGGFKFLLNPKFDLAMVAFLECVQQFRQTVEQRDDKSFKLPYKMDKGKITDSGSQIQFNSEEQWTKALKMMLTNLKWIVAWVAASIENEYNKENTKK